MFNIFKNILCLIIIHILANFEIYLFLFIRFGVYEPFYSLFSEIIFEYFIPIILTIIFGRLLILPIAYKKLENSQKFDLIAKFIQKLKKSFRFKIFVLIVAYFSYLPDGWPYIRNEFYVQLKQGIVFGLLGNYLVLFIYWFIEDKVKNIKNIDIKGN